jgi:hypothetical protein
MGRIAGRPQDGRLKEAQDRVGRLESPQLMRKALGCTEAITKR